MINFDQNATTPVDEAVLNELVRATREFDGNSSSGHSLGLKAGKFLEECRARVAKVLNARKPGEIVFTSGGTESDNAAINGMGWGMREKHGRTGIVTSAIEHRAVLAPCEWLGTQGFRVTVLPVDGNGRTRLDAARAAVNKDTALVSVMLANNEIGTIQPIAELARLAHDHGALIHTDAVQAAGKLELDVQKLDVDAMSLSAHKFYGPKGVGVLYLRDRTPYHTYMLGGTHENNRRAGTVAVPQIAALTVALELADKKRREKGDHLRALRDQLVREVLAKVPGAHLNGDLEHSTLNTASIRFDGVYGGFLLKRMDDAGILASAGSACMWERTKPSHVLNALGLTEEQGSGTIRFSLGYTNTAQEVTQVADTLARLVPALRSEPQPV
ncbi:MAG: cysteine desulfurase [Planctomycetes bacterium]|jgi:cysteine desulfurase|nr:cysteine desulfurase [Planctomycetota bacterium]MCL4730360.1 cysteine desulfurase [Planctomycetota bacterium]